MRPMLMTLLALLIAVTAGGLEIRVQPGDALYLYDNAGEGAPSDLHTAVIQNIALVNDLEQAVSIERVRLEVVKAGEVVQIQIIGRDELARAAKTFHAYQEHGVLAAYDFQFQTSRYLTDVTFPAGIRLDTAEAVVLQRQALLLSGLPDSVSIIADGLRDDGTRVTSEASLRVVDHHSPNEYVFPVRGRWLVAAAPSLHSHHRWVTIQEFALDLVQIGDEGLSHRGDGSRLDMFHAYGDPVVAIGDGVVVAAVGSLPESDHNLQQPDESAESYAERSAADQLELLARGFVDVLGNHVVVEHPHGEFSHYFHLKPGSVTVSAGDRVVRGQVIGALGHSGNSTEPHLHFHLADGPDPACSRSLPVEFVNLTLWPADDGTVRHLHSGQVVSAAEAGCR